MPLPKFQKPSGCAGCLLETQGFGFAPPVGSPSAALKFVGEALGEQEALAGEPFVGAAGSMAHRIFQRAEVSREAVQIGNCVSCQPPGNWLEGAPWQFGALSQCSQYLRPMFDDPRLQVVVTLGGVALKQILDLWHYKGIRLNDFHGAPVRDPSDRFWVVPTYHPSFIQRGATNLFDVAAFDVGVARDIVRKGYTRQETRLIVDPPVDRFRAYVQHVVQRAALEPDWFPLVVDIETPDKAGGRDEGELTADDQSTQIDRVNFACDDLEGWTVPYVDAYRDLIDQLLTSQATLWMWNKAYDEPRLRIRQHALVAHKVIDLMWAAHHVQSDWPLGLGFWASFYSNYGPWKHLGEIKGQEGTYGSLDGVQTYRAGRGIISRLIQDGLWPAFYRHTHLREVYVLRPSHQVGVPISTPRLDAFHGKLQSTAASKLQLIGETEASGTYYPKQGYKRKPKGGPPKSLTEKHREKGDAAKADYVAREISLVQRTVRPVVVGGPTGQMPDPGQPSLLGSLDGPVPPEEVRWFWHLPFNPDSPKQLLKFITDSGETPGRAKKTKKPTTDKTTLVRLSKKTGNPIYQHILDYKAVKKVDATYVVGSKRRIWSDGRLHPLITFRPSMYRDSCVAPNFQNVVADKDKKQTLAAGFRSCVVADPGYRIVEVDYSGIEGLDTGWLCGDPAYIRLATLGVHAYLTSHVLADQGTIGSPASLSWDDDTLAEFFKEIKHKYPFDYDKCKRVVHGNNYGLTPYGMAETFPEVFPHLKDAEHVQEIYYALCPKLPTLHKRMRQNAYQRGYLGGCHVDDYTLLSTMAEHHPFSYRHWFWGVQSLRPLSEANYRRLQYIAQKRLKLERHPRVVIINKRPFEIVLGEDSKRVIAFGPQSIAAGTLKEAEIALFHPESPDYIGEVADGRTPLLAPIHDSLLLHVPDRLHQFVIEHVVNVMRRPIPELPCPIEWGMGTHLRVGVAVKVSPVGGSWADCDEITIPGMMPETAAEILYLPVEEDQYEDVGDLGRVM